MDQLLINLQELKTEGMLEVSGFDEKEFEKLKDKLRHDAEAGDISLKSAFEVIVECPDEAEQERIYNEICEAGYTCRVLTL